MARVDVVMPKMGESITEGTVIGWHKQVGDVVEVDETLLEIGTDKVDTEVPSPSAGRLAEILVPDGSTVDVGTVIAVIESDVSAEAARPVPATPTPADTPTVAATPAPTSSGAASTQDDDKHDSRPAQSSHATESTRAGAKPSGAGRDVVMPKMGESIVEGTVLSWHKKVGDTVEADETLLEIATDKVDTEVPSPEAGTLIEILVAEGETVEVGTVIARIGVSTDSVADGGRPAAEPPSQSPAHSEPQTSQVTPSEHPVAGGPAGDRASRDDGGPVPRIADGRFYSPLVRSIANREGVSVAELRSIAGSGRDGRVTKKDLLAYLSTRVDSTRQPPAPSRTPSPGTSDATPPRGAVAARPADALTSALEDGRVEIIEMDRMRRIIAEHMVTSRRTSAHVTSFAEADVTNLVKLRESEKEAFAVREGIKLTYTPFFVKAAVDALREHPMLNASVDGDRIIIRKDFHIGIAVAIGTTGLVVPVIRTAGQKNIAGLARDASVLADRARARKLQPDDLQGGTFTVTNVGSLGSIMGTPIILQPQVAILATGAIKKRAVVIEDPELGDIIAVRHMMYASLSYDHRIIDGAMAASFLHHFTQNVQTFRTGFEL